MSKEKKLQRKIERDKKLFVDFTNGVRMNPFYEKGKRKSLPNRKACSGDPDAGEARLEENAEKTIRVYKMILPGILAFLGEIEDPRSPNRIEYSLAELMLHAILMFAFGIASRRRANQELSTYDAVQMLSEVFPSITEMPHADTVANLLEKVDAGSLEAKYEECIKKLMGNAEFRDRYTCDGKITILIDGSQGFTRSWQWSEKALRRHVGKDKVEQYYTYYLESVAILKNGAVIPLLTETLERGIASGESKNDCELNAFKRIVPRLYEIFGKGCVNLVVDGLYACGPVISACNKYDWGFMITFKEDSMPSVWADAEGLMKMEPQNKLSCKWGDRDQEYRWINGVNYTYGNNRQAPDLNIVECRETWAERNVRKNIGEETKSARYVWLSSDLISEKNVFDRCTRLARSRWSIENHFLVEKHKGYSFEHCFSYNWNAIKAYHTLMKIAHYINTLVAFSAVLTECVAAKGFLGFRRFAAKLFLNYNPVLIEAIRGTIRKKISLKMREENVFVISSG